MYMYIHIHTIQNPFIHSFIPLNSFNCQFKPFDFFRLPPPFVFNLPMNANLLKHLSQIYHEPNCLSELSEMHKSLMGPAEQIKWRKRLNDAMAREKIARSGLGQRQKNTKKRKAIGGNVHGGGKKPNNGEGGGEGINGQKERNNKRANGNVEGNEGGGLIGEAEANGTGGEGNGNPGCQWQFELDEDFLKTLERLAETSSQLFANQENTLDSAAAANENATKSPINFANSAIDDEQGGMMMMMTGTLTGGSRRTPPNQLADHQQGQQGHEPNDEKAEWRKRFEDVLAVRYEKSERIRFLFCRKMYGHYVERMRQINRLRQELRTCKEKRLIRKFDLDKEERHLLDRSTGKPYLCYEDIFDAIYNCHMQSDVNEMRMLFSQLKEDYANITFECVLEYFKARAKPQQDLALAIEESNDTVNGHPVIQQQQQQQPPNEHNDQPQQPPKQKRLYFLENCSASEEDEESDGKAQSVDLAGGSRGSSPTPTAAAASGEK